MLKLCLIGITVTFIACLWPLFEAPPLSVCPDGWNETDYRCYNLLSAKEMGFYEADAECAKLGLGSRVAYPADNHELALIAAVANLNTVWLGYISDGKTYKTIYNAIGFPNKFEDSFSDTGTEETTTKDFCGIYKPNDDKTSYVLSSQNCFSGKAYPLCQLSYCNPTTSDTKALWLEYKLKCYFLNTNMSTFQEAQDWCVANGANLAVPDTAEENEFVLRIFSNINNPPQRWLGIKTELDNSGNGYWRTVAKTSSNTYAIPSDNYWKGGTAVTAPANNESCTFIEGLTKDSGGWAVKSCSQKLPFICRKTLSQLSYYNCTKGILGKYTSWTADCMLSPGSQTRRWRKCISSCNPPGCSQVTAKYCQFQPKWSDWGPWGGCMKPSKGGYQMASTPCLFNGQRTRNRTCMCGTETCGGCGSSGDSVGKIQSANCNIFISRLCPAQECTYCAGQFAHTHCYEDGSTDSLTNNFRCVCDLGYNRKPSKDGQAINMNVPMGCNLEETSDDNTAADCNCADESLMYNECDADYSSCTTEQLCQYPQGGPHTCFCLPGYRKIPSGGCVAASRIPPQCKIVSGSNFIKDSRGYPLIPYERGYICTCGLKDLLVQAGYSTRNSTTGEEAAARIVSRDGNYMCYCMRATVSAFLRADPVTNRPVETKFNLTRQFMENFPECERGYFDNMTYPKIPADLFIDVDAKLADLQKRTYFKCTGAEGFNSRFEYLTQPVLGEALSTPLEEPDSENDALRRLLSVDEAAIDLFQSLLSPDCETQRSYLTYIDVMSGTEVFIGNVSSADVNPTFVQMQCGNWSFPPEAVDRSQYPGIYQPLIAHCYVDALRFKSKLYNSTLAAANGTTLDKFLKSALKSKSWGFSFTNDYSLPTPMINTGVMSISTNPEILRMPAGVYLTIYFPLREPPVGFFQPHCTFYDFNYITGATWRTGESGCQSEFVNTTNGIGYVKCKCNHMTVFAATMIEVIPSSYYLAVMILNAIVIGGSAMSILCLALTLLIYVQLRRFSTERIGIMILCFAIAMTQALLLAGAKLTVSPSTCRIISICLHFFGLLTFSLIGSLSLAMYFRFVSRFRKGWHNMAAYYGMGFVIPTFTVVITAGGFFDSYGVSYSCWMDMEGLIKWAFFVPFLVIGVFSLYLLIKTAPILYKVKSANVKSFSQAEVYGIEFKYGVQKREKVEIIFQVSKKKFWGLIILLVILTITWVLGVLSMQYESIYYDYGFAIFNASQGFFIFIMFCVREEEVRILCCAGCMTKQQPAGKISWEKFVEIYERYFSLVLHNEEQEKRKMTFSEFVSQEYKSGSILPEEIIAMGSREYVSAQRGLVKPNYLLTCSCCFPVRTAPMPTSVGADTASPPSIDLTQKLFVVGPDGQLMCLDRDGQNAAEIMEEIGTQRPGSVSAVTGSAGPRRLSAQSPAPTRPAAPTQPPAQIRPPAPIRPFGATRPPGPTMSSGPVPGRPIVSAKPVVTENWAPPPTLFPEFPDSDEEGDVAADIAAEVKINRDIAPPPAPPPPPQSAPKSRTPSASRSIAEEQKHENAYVEDIEELNDKPSPDKFKDEEQGDFAPERHKKSSTRTGSAVPAESGLFRPTSAVDSEEEDFKPEPPVSARKKKKSKKATSELDPMDIE